MKLVDSNSALLYTPATVVLPTDNLEWVDEMMQICQRSGIGVGIAGPQVGFLKRVCYIDPTRKGGILAANPVIVSHSEATTMESEGCLSYPGVFVKIRRWQIVNISYTPIILRNNRNVLSDQEVCSMVEGLEGRIWQHEIDHLNGICQVGDEYRSRTNANRQAVSALFGRGGDLMKRKYGI